jgi:TRAP-type transport system periplasmic protein
LQMGLIDAQVNPLFAIYSMKFYEVQDYVTQLKSEPFIGIPTANQEFFDGLPKGSPGRNAQILDRCHRSGRQWITGRNASDMEKMKAEKPSLKFHTLDERPLRNSRRRPKRSIRSTRKSGVKGAEKVLDALLKDIENAKKALNIE